MAKMKAAVVTKFGDPLDIREETVPEVPEDRILVRVRASGVCHTDLHAAHGDWPVQPKLPFIPGHEGVGEVAQVGGKVRGIKEGDRVGVPWLHTACGRCEHCITGWETLCEQQQNTGYSVDGGFAEYVVADPDYVGHLPNGLDYGPAAPVLCAGVTVYKGLKQTDTKPGDWVLISGIGGLGHLAVQYAKAMGRRVAAVDIADEKLELARELGADAVFNAANGDAVKEVQSQIGGVHGAVITAVSTKAFEQALGMMKRGGTMALNGLPPGSFPLPIFEVVLKGLTVRGSIVGTRMDLSESLAFAADHAVESHFHWDDLDNINGIFGQMQQNKIDGRIVMNV